MKTKTPYILKKLHWTHSNHQALSDSLGACTLDDFHRDWHPLKKFRTPKKKKRVYTWAEITVAIVVVTAMVLAYVLK